MASKNKRFRSLAARLSFGIIIIGTFVFVTVLGANYFLSRNLLEEYIGHLARASFGEPGLVAADEHPEVRSA